MRERGTGGRGKNVTTSRDVGQGDAEGSARIERSAIEGGGERKREKETDGDRRDRE